MDPGFRTVPTTPASVQSSAMSANYSSLSGTPTATTNNRASFKCSESNPTKPVDNLNNLIIGITRTKDHDLTAKLADLSLCGVERGANASSSCLAFAERLSSMPDIHRVVEGHNPTVCSTTTTCTHKDRDGHVTAVSPDLVAYEARKQILFDTYAVPKSIQFELARGIDCQYWAWDQITESLLRDLGRYDRYFQKVQEIYRRLAPDSQQMREAKAYSQMTLLFVYIIMI